MFDIPIVLIEQVSGQLEFEIKDASEQAVGRAVQIEAPPRGRTAVQVVGLNGAPAFSVESGAGGPTAVLDAKGAPVGTFESDQEATAAEARRLSSRSPLRGLLTPFLGGPTRPPLYHLLRDASGRRVCGMEWEQKRRSVNQGVMWVPTTAHYTDSNGARIARLDYFAGRRGEYTLKIEYRLPEPLRTLVLASPLAFALGRS